MVGSASFAFFRCCWVQRISYTAQFAYVERIKAHEITVLNSLTRAARIILSAPRFELLCDIDHIAALFVR